MIKLATLATAAILATGTSTAQASERLDPVKNIVLVHGAFVDGSGWSRVYRGLKKEGYNVIIVQNPITSLTADVAATKRAIAKLHGPVILVGHSYGGAVISEAGIDPQVQALVYVAAFVPDAGESVSTLVANSPPGSAAPPILPPQDGFLLLDKAKFASAFAADVDPEEAQFMADSQLGWSVEAFAGSVNVPAWRSKPSWYLVATEDKMIPPTAQHDMAKRAGAAVSESKASHAVYVSQPAAVVKIIVEAASEANNR